MTDALLLPLERETFSADRSELAVVALQGRQHATFVTAKTAPLHRWYPFLEGYSPEFVLAILRSHAPSAQRILDPFAGVGTTPLVVAMDGRESFYAEVDPFLGFLIEAKATALSLNDRQRASVVMGLERAAHNLATTVHGATPDTDLRDAYGTTFGKSQYFDQDTFETILRLRTVLDDAVEDDPLVGRLTTVAALRSLVPASRLIRAGDLRYRRDDELDGIRPLISEVEASLRAIADDIISTPKVTTAPVFVASDARRLRGLPSMGIDAVVTSPPYLNGTNYMRNTKIELWFGRHLGNASDLSALRRRAITAGINNVTRSSKLSDDPEVIKLCDRLIAKAYDSRIPRMVSAYFQDMEYTLEGISHHLVANGVLAIDIGDSTYGGVRVATGDILISLARKYGFELVGKTELRSRISRDGSKLSQDLLVLRNRAVRPRAPAGNTTQRPEWWLKWRAFERVQPHHLPPMSKRNWGHPLHSLCSYQGKMKPSLANQLVTSLVDPGSVILDPFAGVATIPFEAALNGVESYGFEISPAALVIATAKVNRAPVAEALRLVEKLDSFVRNEHVTTAERQAAAAIKVNGRLEDYFHEKTLDEVVLARRYFQLEPPRTAEQYLVMACLLHILHGNRPYALSRRSHPITPFAPSGPTEYRDLKSRLLQKLVRSQAVDYPENFAPSHILKQDATADWPPEISEIDAVITSPPFFDSTRFYMANWMRLWFAGWELGDFARQPREYVDERQKLSFSVYESILRQARERLKPNGLVALHLGESKKCDMAAQLTRVASPWFKVARLFSENVEHCESHGIRDKGTVTAHQYLILQ